MTTTKPLTSHQTLRASLEAHNATFENLLKLIPAKYYIVNDATELEIANKFQKHSKKQKGLKHAAEVAASKQEAKRRKLDPEENQKSIIDIQQEYAAKTNPKSQKAAAAAEEDEGVDEMEWEDASSDVDLEGDDDDEEEGDADEGDEDDVVEGGDVDDQKLVPMPVVEGGITALRQKLHDKMDKLRNRNRGYDSYTKDELLEERRQQRAALRERRRKETKERLRRESELKKSKGASKSGDKGGEKGKDGMNVSGNVTRPQLLVSDPKHHTGQPSDQDPSKNYTSIAYSLTSNHKPTGKKGPSNPAQALAQLQNQKTKIASLPASTQAAIKAREAIKTAEMRLEGVKVKDDEKRLKKAVKREEKKKEKGRAEWNDRKEKVAMDLKARQKKRADNIAMRSEGRKRRDGAGAKGGSKGKGGADKGKVRGASGKPKSGGKGKGGKRPGFEGKR